MKHGLHDRDMRMRAERLHGAEDHGLPANDAILFRSATACAKSAAGCDEDGGSPFRICHATQITVIAVDKRRRLPDVWIRPGALITAGTKKRGNPEAWGLASRAAIAALHLHHSKNCLKCRHET